MDPFQLVRDELEYELLVRGYSNLTMVTALDMKKTLARILTTEKFGSLANERTDDIDFNEELNVCTRKVVEIQTIAESVDSTESNDGKKFFAKLSHVLGRLARITTETDDINAAVKKLQNELNQLESVVFEKVDTKQNASSHGAGSAITITNHPTQTNPAPSRKQIPVHKWNISFSGDDTGLSVNGFLERVNEYRISRNVTPAELFNSTVELLKGSALIWYRSVRSRITTWDEFVQLLRTEFEPYGYETELWAEIRARSQGPNERVGNYFACMVNLFARLPTPPREDEKLAVLRRNILPYFIHNSGLTEFRTVDELLSMCKRLENNKYMATNYQPPTPPRRQLLEPDLACPSKQTSRTCTVETGNVHPKASLQCWNCKQPGHIYKNCQSPRITKFCYSCGTPDCTKATCPKCSKRYSKNERD